MNIYIDPDITLAETLPGWVYHDDTFFEKTWNKLLLTHWHWLGKIPVEPGIYPVHLYPDTPKPIPLLLTIEKNSVAILSNVCTHRGSLLLTHNSQHKVIQCPYHGRCFRNNGEFISMPEFEGVKNFPSKGDHLPAFTDSYWGPFHWVILQSESQDLVSHLNPLERVSFMDLSHLRPVETHSYTLDINWMLYCENYLEGFHIPYVHPELNRVLDYHHYETILYPQAVLQIGYSDNPDLCFSIPDAHMDAGKNIAAYYYWFYPNLMLNFYPWGISVNRIEPLSTGKTRIIYETHQWADIEAGAGQDLAIVEEQDQAILRKVSQGTQSPFYQRGRYSPRFEKGVHHFHRLICHTLDT